MNITYSELLKNQNWAKIRKEILKRDLLECQECQNQNIKINSVVGEILSVKRILTALELLNKSNPRFNKLYKVDFLDSSHKENSVEIKAIFEYKKDELEKFSGQILYYNEARNLDFLNTNSDYKTITCIPDPTERSKWFYINQLHIHHTYYESKKKPWEYPLESLQTLCWVCHQKVHNN